MENWVLIASIASGILFLIIVIVFVAKTQKRVKLKREQQAILQKEEAERLRKQKRQEKIDAKLNAILERRKQIQEQFDWLGIMNKEIQAHSKKKPK